MFRKLIDLLKPAGKAEEPAEPVLGLTEAEIGMLRDLSQTDEWQVYKKAIDAQTILYGEAMLHARDTNVLHEMRGWLLGLRQAGLLIDQILSAEKEKEEHERRRSTVEPLNAAAVATYGSEYWTGQRKDAAWRGTEIWRQ